MRFRISKFSVKIHLVIFLQVLMISAFGQTQSPKFKNEPKPYENKYNLNWTGPLVQKFGDDKEWACLSFSGGQYDFDSRIPFLILNCANPGEDYTPIINYTQIEQIIDPKEISICQEETSTISNDFEKLVFTKTIQKKKFTVLKIIPIRKRSDGSFEKITALDVEWKKNSSLKVNSLTVPASFASSSVLASGNWYKFATSQKGIFKLTKNNLRLLGLDVNSIDPRNIRIYGNGGRALPESNAAYRPDDLVENAIFVEGESDGVFDENDYVVFYAQSPVAWNEQANGSCMKFRHRVNPYSDSSYYFLTVDLGPGKRIQQQLSSALNPNETVTSFDDYQYYENNSVNLIKSGREWYGEYFDILTSYSFNFSFPNIVVGDTVKLEAAIANRMGNTDANAYSIIHPGGTTSLTTGIVWLNNYTAAYAADGSACTSFLASSPTFPITIVKNNSAAVGWLNYIRLNARRNLISSVSTPTFFRDTRSVGVGKISKFIINSTGGFFIWDVTDIYNVKSQQFVLNGNSIEFKQTSDSLKEYVVFNPAQLPSPNYCGMVKNQNLHSLNPAEYIIISHYSMLPAAQKLADFHFQKDSISYVIVTPEQCYNEFSSGSQDITAIREFVRMLYNKASNQSETPKYLLLLGDGSYKYKNSPGNSNFIPTYQSPQSLQPTSSYTSDDFFGLLDSNEGDFTGDVVDIGIGRFPCQNLSEAMIIVDKIINYCRTNQSVSSEISSCINNSGGPFGDWRNWVCFVADDEDQSLHLIQADTLANRISREHPSYNINKIYFDAYKQESTPGGQSYPDANREFGKQIEKGCLIINYTGHGGELGLAHENLVGISQIQQYNNNNNLPMWFTATCEFSRYDDPDRISAGEYVFLNPNGAGIALFSTVRLVYASSNFALSQIMWNYMLDSVSGRVPTMGDVFMLGKQGAFADANTRNFTLLGDPALKLAYPKQVIHTDSINGKSVSTYADTLKALKKVTIKGHISDAQGNKLNNFNGIIFPIVFDKVNSITSLSNDVGSPPITFKVQKNIIYKGKSSVKNGDFSFTFVVPKDIAYNFGAGRISYYAYDGSTDATGYFTDALVGGSESNFQADQTPPEIKLYMNDNRFVSGGTTNENPSIYAEITDSSGINTVGNGIGHDIVAILDNNSDAPIVLNDYYQADMDNYQSGKILYGLENLSEGLHRLSLKVWDVQNNSETSFTEFVVAKSEELALTHVLNYPNPFSSRTQFFLEHNNCCSKVNVSINVFTISGKVVKSITKTLEASGFRSEGIEWDAKDDFGDKLGKGVYIYKVKISDDSGKSAEQFQKLVILN
ncbi:MAG: type IX secretion system sortase PorU [Bacteroidota bacterium]